MRREVLLRLSAAWENLEDAELMLEEGRRLRAAFFAEQAVEKALKALYPLLAGVEPPRLRSVTELYRGGSGGGGSGLPGELGDKLCVLNKYYTVTRYPDAVNGLPSESVDLEEAERAVEVAGRILGYIEEVVVGAGEEAAG